MLKVNQKKLDWMKDIIKEKGYLKKLCPQIIDDNENKRRHGIITGKYD